MYDALDESISQQDFSTFVDSGHSMGDEAAPIAKKTSQREAEDAIEASSVPADQATTSARITEQVTPEDHERLDQISKAMMADDQPITGEVPAFVTQQTLRDRKAHV